MKKSNAEALDYKELNRAYEETVLGKEPNANEPMGGGTGIKPSPVTKRQIALLAENVGKMVWLKADRVLGIGREQVKLLSLNVENGTAQVEVPDWGEETAYLFMFVRLY